MLSLRKPVFDLFWTGVTVQRNRQDMSTEQRLCQIESWLLKLDEQLGNVFDELKHHRRESLDHLHSLSLKVDKAETRLDQIQLSLGQTLKTCQQLDSHNLKLLDQLAHLKEQLSLVIGKEEQQFHGIDYRLIKADRRFEHLSNRFDQLQKLMNEHFAVQNKHSDESLERLHHALKDMMRELGR